MEAYRVREGAIMTTTEDRTTIEPPEPVRVSPALIQAAKLEVTINDRRGVPTDPVIRELAQRKG
jgi:hypothetical protein